MFPWREKKKPFMNMEYKGRWLSQLFLPILPPTTQSYAICFYVSIILVHTKPKAILQFSYEWASFLSHIFKGAVQCSVFEPQISRHSTGGSFCLFTFASKRSLSNICQSWGCTFDTKLGTSLFLQGSFMGFLWAATKLPTNCWPITVKCNWR